MVTLKEIKRNGNLIYFNYFAESDDSDIGEIVYDVETKKAIKHMYCKKDINSNLKTYYHKAIRAIERCIRNDNFEEPVIYMWY